jgi:hypothetical protein
MTQKSLVILKNAAAFFIISRPNFSLFASVYIIEKKYCVISSAWPEVDRRFWQRLLLLKRWFWPEGFFCQRIRETFLLAISSLSSVLRSTEENDTEKREATLRPGFGRKTLVNINLHKTTKLFQIKIILHIRRPQTKFVYVRNWKPSIF